VVIDLSIFCPQAYAIGKSLTQSLSDRQDTRRVQWLDFDMDCSVKPLEYALKACPPVALAKVAAIRTKPADAGYRNPSFA
jgi:hypothetical protein